MTSKQQSKTVRRRETVGLSIFPWQPPSSADNGYHMSQNDIQTLEANFANWRTERLPDTPESEAFEVYAIEQVLKDADLSDEDISAGNFGKGDDGGVDAMYFFVNRGLMRDGGGVPSPALEAEIVIIQAKKHAGFGETPITLLESFVRDMLDYTKPVPTLTYLNVKARDCITFLRGQFEAILRDVPTITVTFHYVTKSVEGPNSKVEKRVENLKALVRSSITHANINFEFWGCSRLLASKRKAPGDSETIPIQAHFDAPDGSFVCLVLLKDFAAMLTDEKGGIKTRLLEANVRDYQGKTRQVNEDIKKTLETANSKEDFWWLNNGVTILADDCAYGAKKMTIKRPEIVNGLQTSYEIFYARERLINDKRAVLLRIITVKAEDSRNSITKATNSQTPISRLTLRATEKIHFDIEDRLGRYNLFYDRKKGKYKRLGKKIAQIVSMREMAQATMTTILRRPDNARARPGTVTDDESQYKLLFCEDYDITVYTVSIMLDRAVRQFLTQSSVLPDDQVNIHYYVLLATVSELTRSATPTIEDIAGLLPVINAGTIQVDALKTAADLVVQEYQRLGGTDQISKGPDLLKTVEEQLRARWPVVSGGARGKANVQA